MNPTSLIEIDGRRFYYMFLAGAKMVIKNQLKLNKINVFPVKDCDTGTNMASTVQAIINSVKPDRSYKKMAGLIAEKALINARGNSGIIFAQFLYGLSNETSEKSSVSLNHFAESVKKSVNYVYQAVANPVEGTMLTIIRAWADFIYSHHNKFNDFDQLFLKSLRILEKTLAETKFQLQVLMKANVVDAGANAFFYFIKGMTELIRLKNIKQLIKSKSKIQTFKKIDEEIPQVISFRYCTEGIVKNLTKDHQTLSNVLQTHGDSVVVAGSLKTSRIHVHTNDPAKLFQDIQDFGTITSQKVDDMLRQSQAVNNRKWNIALVSDSACDLPQDLIDHYQIHMLPLNIYFGENHFLDKITIQPDQFYGKLHNKGSYPKTAQINEITFRNLFTHLASHYDAVIAVHLTGNFSGTYHSSKKAAEKISREFKKPITVIDSKNISGALGLLVLRIAQAIEAHVAYNKILTKAEKWIEDSHIFVSVKTLKYMVRGGRVSYFKGLIGKLLNINPIVSMDEKGQSMVFGKTYNQRSNINKVINNIKNICQNKKIWNYIILHANNLKGADWYTQKMKSAFEKDPVAVVNISPVIGANAGIGAASVAFMFD